ncbi:MAG: class I SAM-dependent methyltransferase [Pirellulales bacterium]|nr:class I SAM-dependent methyltransferase [Pirellulales bacterium]
MDQSKVEAFQKQMLNTMNNAGLALMTSLGHRTKLFDTMATMTPSTSQQIAAAAKLSERYVREWLGAMVTGGTIEYDAKTDRYRLPEEHAASLTRAAMPNNLAGMMQWVAVLGNVEDRVLAAFEHGKGVGYECYHRFHQVMAEESNQTTVSALIDAILPLVPGLVARLQQGIDVLDIGCGSGRAINEMATHFPSSRFTGYDISKEGTAAAQAEARERGSNNAQFEVRDVASFHQPGAFDLITAFDAIHDQAKPAEVLRSIAVSLKPGGIFLMQDIKASSRLQENLDHPLGPFLYTISCLHCMSVSLAAGGPGLGAAWGRQLALTMLSEAGFKDVEVTELPHDPINYYYLCRPAS